MATKQTQGTTREEEFELPPGYESRGVGFRRAFEHAKRHGNGDKAALLYAEAWAHDFEETGEDDE
jgi:hypothetical protein